MVRLFSAIILSALGLAGCSVLQPAATETAGTPVTAAASICEPLGPLTARVDCDCYDKMSYDKVKGQAKENLYDEARVNYPDSNRVEVASVSLYLNQAVARGTAYRCPSLSGS